MNFKNWLRYLCKHIMTSKNLKLVSHKLVNANDTSIIVTIEYLISLLRAWQQDKITTAQFYKTIEILHSSDTEFLDWENNGELVTSEHIPSESVTSMQRQFSLPRGDSFLCRLWW